MEVYWDMLSIDCPPLIEINDFSIAVEEFYTILCIKIDRHVPFYKHHQRKFPVLYIGQLINNIKQEDKMRNK